MSNPNTPAYPDINYQKGQKNNPTIYTQASFKGGMNLLQDDTRISSSEYREAFNVRNRFDVLTPVNGSSIDTTAPAGLKQGLYSFDDFFILFVAGLAYWKRFDSAFWTLIPEFLMSTTAPYIYTQAVPASTFNYQRKASSATNINAPVNVLPGFNVSGTIAALLVQDGINQPFVIYLDPITGLVTSRVTNNYSQWSNDTTGIREYVPIGTLMLWNDDILWVIDTDSKTLLRSVSGRPLDFMVNVDINGNKAATELLGGARTTAYAVGYNKITCIQALNTSSFFVGTVRGCYVVNVDATNTIFGEPTFTNTYLFNAGVISQFSFIDILGDFAFIDPEGLRSFNAVLQEQNEGRNAVFSIKCAKLFKKINQTILDTASIMFDNYALFCVKTIYDHVILVYDTLAQTFVGMDTINSSIPIKMFAKIDTDTTQLYAITQKDTVLHLYDSEQEVAFSSVRTQAWSNDFPGVVAKPIDLLAIFTDVYSTTNTIVSILTDGQKNSIINNGTLYKTIDAEQRSIDYPVTFPVMFNGGRDTFYNYYNFQNAKLGWKVAFIISWQGSSTLSHLAFSAKPNFEMSPLMSQYNAVTLKSNG